jgi:putative tryptophan/tyrosine transport system substrate-binding protein
MASHIERRKFLATLGGAAAAWPLAAWAQQPERMRHIGVLMPFSSDDAESQTRMGAFLQALALSGWTIGRNVRIDTRWGARDAERIHRHALELAALAPDIEIAKATAMEVFSRRLSHEVGRILPGGRKSGGGGGD